ncbi:MAG TPA: hypothetical protein VF618_09490 [Thermoanaerobaculia bacterium]
MKTTSWRCNVIRSRIVLLFSLLLTTTLYAQNLDMGSRYEFIDQQALTVTTTFKDAVVTTERMPSGDLLTTLATIDGQTAASMTGIASKTELRFRIHADRATDSFTAKMTMRRPTADWANAQLYLLWKERVRGSRNVTWQGDFITRLPKARLAVEAAPTRQTVADQVLEIETKFADARVRSVRHQTDGVKAPTWTTGLWRGEHVLVKMRYFAADEALEWLEPNGQIAYVNRQNLEQPWTFTPNPAWANIQAYSLYYHHREKGTLPEGNVVPKPAPEPGRLHVDADYDGCTGLHWLDDTVYRACCDEHDRCYNKANPNCTAWSWIWPGSWHCFICNINVVRCFLTAPGGPGTWNPRNQDPIDGSCGYDEGFICPAYCSYCK